VISFLNGGIKLIIYVVKPGDTVFNIARRYGMDPQRIISDNELANPDRLAVGQALVLMTETIPHTVTRGESLYAIARKYGVAPEAVIAANPQLSDPSRLQVGQIVNVPVIKPRRGDIRVNGYAFPSITMQTLEKTLPYLTYLSIFSYQARPDGSLSGINDTPLIAAARQARVAPLMVVTNIEEGGGFSSELVSTLLTDGAARSALITNIEQTLAQKNYYGVNIDFEYIYPEDGDAYDSFLAELTSRLNPQGYIVTTSLAPKTSAGQPGLLYEAHRYPVHGRLVNLVILMTYEWGYTYGRR